MTGKASAKSAWAALPFWVCLAPNGSALLTWPLVEASGEQGPACALLLSVAGGWSAGSAVLAAFSDGGAEVFCESVKVALPLPLEMAMLSGGRPFGTVPAPSTSCDVLALSLLSKRSVACRPRPFALGGASSAVSLPSAHVALSCNDLLFC